MEQQKQQSNSEENNNKTWRKFIFSNIDKKKLEEKSKENKTLAIKKIRKCRLQKNKFFVQFKQSQRINYVKKKFQTNDVISAILANKNNENGNFSEEEYSSNSASYMDVERAHQIEKEISSLKRQQEKQLLELKHQQQEDLINQRQSFEIQLCEQQRLFKEQQAQTQEQQAKIQEKFQRQLQEQSVLIKKLQEKIEQYESYQFKDTLSSLNGLKNYLETEKIQNKILKFAQRLKSQKYTEKQLIKDEQVAEDQALAQIVFKISTAMLVVSSSNEKAPLKTPSKC